MSDPLVAPFSELCNSLRGLQDQVEQLARVHDAVDDFNSAFGAFQGAMALHASCVTYPKNVPVPAPTGRNSLSANKKQPSPGTGILLPKISHVSPTDSDGQKKQGGSLGGKRKTNGESKQMKKTLAGMKRQGKVDSNNSRTKKRKTEAHKAKQPAWAWERHIREKIPRKYQSPAELKKLENIVLYLKNRHCPISITDLVKHSGLAVIRCKEILQTLMRLEIVERKREKSGFVYSFSASN